MSVVLIRVNIVTCLLIGVFNRCKICMIISKNNILNYGVVFRLLCWYFPL